MKRGPGGGIGRGRARCASLAHPSKKISCVRQLLDHVSENRVGAHREFSKNLVFSLSLPRPWPRPGPDVAEELPARGVHEVVVDLRGDQEALGEEGADRGVLERGGHEREVARGSDHSGRMIGEAESA